MLLPLPHPKGEEGKGRHDESYRLEESPWVRRINGKAALCGRSRANAVFEGLRFETLLGRRRSRKSVAREACVAGFACPTWTMNERNADGFTPSSGPFWLVMYSETDAGEEAEGDVVLPSPPSTGSVGARPT